jgi:hypothetical protein
VRGRGVVSAALVNLCFGFDGGFLAFCFDWSGVFCSLV